MLMCNAILFLIDVRIWALVRWMAFMSMFLPKASFDGEADKDE
jgi:F0F1-type ATP synthase assembly protein I